MVKFSVYLNRLVFVTQSIKVGGEGQWPYTFVIPTLKIGKIVNKMTCKFYKDRTKLTNDTRKINNITKTSLFKYTENSTTKKMKFF